MVHLGIYRGWNRYYYYSSPSAAQPGEKRAIFSARSLFSVCMQRKELTHLSFPFSLPPMEMEKKRDHAHLHLLFFPLYIKEVEASPLACFVVTMTYLRLTFTKIGDERAIEFNNDRTMLCRCIFFSSC